LAITSLEEWLLKTVATIEFQDGGKEFRTIATKFFSVISAPNDLAYDSFSRRRAIWVGKSFLSL